MRELLCGRFVARSGSWLQAAETREGTLELAAFFVEAQRIVDEPTAAIDAPDAAFGDARARTDIKVRRSKCSR